MKKILVLLFMVLPLVAMSQSKARRGLIIGDPDGGAVTIDSIVQESGRYVIYTGATAKSAFNDSIYILYSDMVDIEQRLDLAENALDALRESDNTAPTLTSGVVNKIGELILTMSEVIEDTNTDTIKNALSFKEDGNSVTIDSVDIIDESGIIVCYTDTVAAGDTLTVSYTAPATANGIRDASDNTTVSWTDSSVTNNLVNYYDFLAFYQAENTYVDSAGNYNGAQIGSTTFDSDNEKCDSYAFSLDGTGDAVNCGQVNTTGEFTVAGWFNITEDADEYLFANRGPGVGTGWDVNVNTNEQITFQLADGVNSSFAYAQSTGWTWDSYVFFAMTVSKTLDSARFYVDGVEYHTDGTFNNYDFATSGQNLYFGNNTDADAGVQGYIDEVMIFDEVLGADEILYLYENACSDYYYPSSPDPAPADTTDFTSYADSIFAWNAEDESLGLFDYNDYNASFYRHAPDGNHGFGYYLPNQYDTAVHIYASGDNQYAQVENFEGHYSLIFSTTDDTGHGCLMGAKFTSDQTGYTDVYFTYNVRVKPGFAPPQGGKFMGARGGTTPLQANDASDWSSYNGFDAMMAFKGDLDALGYSGAVLILYLMHIDKPYTPGGWAQVLAINDPYSKDWYEVPTDGSWFNITTRVVMNNVYTQDNGNGFIEVFVNGRFAFRTDDIRLAKDSSVGADRFQFYFQFGGGSPDDAAIQDEYVQYDDIYVFKYLGLNDEPTGFQKSSPDRQLELPNWDTESDQPVHTGN